ncbi:MAG: hypothetical protein M1834_002047 [Cirrosporium novae-zelandiae]|nr:MAG: hypothetical protein M1834_002047 [Cirrosporium novae-zelandiae]
MPPQLPTRKLGKNGPQVTALGFGFKKTRKRDEIFFSTKFRIYETQTGDEFRSDPEYTKKACAKSLNRLGVDTIDLYCCHRIDRITPIEKTVETMAELKREGKIRYLGLSQCSSTTLRRACKVHHIDAIQIEYSPFSMDIENPKIGLMQTCRELGVAIVAYSPLARGFITGQYKSPDDFEEGDWRKMAPRFSKENFPKNLEFVDKMKKIADKKGCTPSQLTLAWLMAQGDDIIPIPGTKKVKYLEENLGALDVKLTDTDIAEVRQAVENTEVVGNRFLDRMEAYIFADTPELS